MKNIKPLLNQISMLFNFLKFKLFIFLGLVLIIGSQSTVSIYINKLIIDNLTIMFTGKGENQKIIEAVLLFVLFQFLVAIVINVLGSLYEWLKEIWSKQISLEITSSLYNKLNKISYADFENPKVLDMFQLAQSQMNYTPMGIINNLTNILQYSIGLIGMCVILATQNWLTLIPAILMALPSFLFENHFARKLYTIQKRKAPFQRKQNYLQQLLFKREYAMELSFFGVREKITNRMISLGRLFIRQDYKIMKTSIFWGGLIELLSNLTYWGYYILLVFGISAKRYSLGDFTLYSGAFKEIQSNVRIILFNMSSIYKHTLFIQNYYNFLALSEEKTALNVKTVFEDAIEFQDVSFSYPNTEKKVLQNVNLRINKNDKIALVGENGSGKSTFIKLLLGFYNSYSGKILIDGIELRQYKKKDLWNMFGVVFQDYQSYSFTVKENIQMSPSNTECIELAVKAAKKSGADSFINKLPKQFSTILGKIFNDGHELSRGQWQKMAISRCFIRNADIFIMDEPAASLDPNSEAHIYTEFHNHVKDKTAILISHRLSNVNKLDRIMVFDNGAIIEKGNHDELMSRGGKYANLFKKQSSGYTEKLAVCQ